MGSFLNLQTPAHTRYLKPPVHAKSVCECDLNSIRWYIRLETMVRDDNAQNEIENSNLIRDFWFQFIQKLYLIVRAEEWSTAFE